MTTIHWNDDSFWQLKLTNEELSEYYRIVLGNGLVGTAIDRLIIADWTQPVLPTYSRLGYDGGQIVLLPAWNHVDLTVRGIVYAWENGVHDVTQILDLRTGVATLSDCWEYIPGKKLHLEIRLFLPRQQPMAARLSLHIHNFDKELIHFKFGLRVESARLFLRMNFINCGKNCIAGDYRGNKEGTPIEQALAWQFSGGETTVAISLNQIDAESSEPETELQLVHALSFPDSTYPDRCRAADIAQALLTQPEDKTLTENAGRWRKLWADALLFADGGPGFMRDLVIWQYFLLGNLSEFPCVTGALGVWGAAWGGRQFWDADFWLFRATLLLWPDLARSIPEWRGQTIIPARKNAAGSGYRGIWFPWQADGKGRCCTPSGYIKEVHLNIWVALAAWAAFRQNGADTFLHQVTWPILSGIAEFFCSRATKEKDGLFHIRQVVGPNEAVEELQHTLVDDNMLTNYGVRKVLELAISCADRSNEPVPSEWLEVYEKIFLLEPSTTGVIPEHSNYCGEGIKQADLILIFYPLEYPASADTVCRNVHYYSERFLTYGPMMSTAISALLLMREGKKMEGLNILKEQSEPFLRGPHRLICECRSSDNRNIFFLAGAGGVLQALLYGYFEADINHTASIPQVKNLCPDFPGWK